MKFFYKINNMEMKMNNNKGLVVFIVTLLVVLFSGSARAQKITSISQSTTSVGPNGGNIVITLNIVDVPDDFQLEVKSFSKKIVNKINGYGADILVLNMITAPQVDMTDGYKLTFNVGKNEVPMTLNWVYDIETNAGRIRVEFRQFYVYLSGINAGMILGKTSMSWGYDDIIVSPGYVAHLERIISPTSIPSGYTCTWATLFGMGTTAVATPIQGQTNPERMAYTVNSAARICYAVMYNNQTIAYSNAVYFRLASKTHFTNLTLSSSASLVNAGGTFTLYPSKRFPYVTSVSYKWEKLEPGQTTWTEISGQRGDTLRMQNVLTDACYRRVTYFSGDTVRTSSVFVRVKGPEGGLINTSTPHPARGASVNITSEQLPRYTVNAYTWEKRVLGTSTWSVVAGQTSSTCQISSIDCNTSFRRKAVTSNGTFYSNELTVYPDVVSSVEVATMLDPTTMVSSAREIKDVRYKDGLGRDHQTIQVGASPSGGDIIVPVKYGVHGRVENSYLAYSKTSDNGRYDPNAFAAANWSYLGSAEQAYAFTRTTFDDSPLGRVVKQIGPGMVWHEGARGTTVSYEGNQANQVKKWSVDADGQLQGGSTYYPANSLSRVLTTDEDGHVVEEFSDWENRVLLLVTRDGATRLETYSVYDDRGLLRYVLSPEASVRVGSTANRTTEAIRQYGYYYEYDRLGRQTLKQLPGCDPVYMVYDGKDRLVLSQDGNQRSASASKWSYSLYDNQNRVVETGEVVLSAVTTHAALQTAASSSLNYTPAGTRTALQYTLHDTYTGTANVPVKPFLATEGYSSSYHTLVTGLVTSVRTWVLETDTWLVTTTYYDDRCRVIQTVSDNLQGFTSRVDLKYDFVGNVIKQRESHQVAANRTDVLESENAYDDRGRLLSSTVKLNNGSPATTSYTYDAVGRLVSVKRGNTTEALTYNVRGWLIGKESAPFKMRLRYENPSGGADTCWNGNISEWEWQHGTGAALMYGFAYDGVNRLTGTVQKQKSGTTWLALSGSYLEKGITYDRNGNIKTLQRTANGTTVDDLVYSYTGNQLTGLTENASGTPAGDVYTRGSAAAGSYAYDKNGNLVNDSRRALNLSYNVLNLLGEVKTGSTVKARYSYLADGTKLRVRDAGSNGFDYLGSLTYKSGGGGLQLESASFGDGVILAGTGGQEMNYFLTDHLGSVRVIVDGSGVVKERNDYYPFGARHARADYPQLATNRFKFNGKEEQVTGDLGYLDYGWRMLDKGLGRWFGVDPMLESYVSFSPYSYCLSNPVNLCDPTGAWVEGPHGGLTTSDPREIYNFWSALQYENDHWNGSSSFIDWAWDFAMNDTWGNTLYQSDNTRFGYTLSEVQVRGSWSRKYVTLSSMERWCAEYGATIGCGNYFDLVEQSGYFYGNKSPLSPEDRQILFNRGVVGRKDFLEHPMTQATFNTLLFVATGGIEGLAALGNLGRGLIGNIKIPIYRVYGGQAAMYGRSYSLFNPKYVPMYRNFAGLPDVNTGQYLLKGYIPIKQLRVGRWFAAPLDGNMGGLPFELYQSYNQLIRPANVLLKRSF